MNKIPHRVVKRDGGWAYEANGTYSEQFRTREAARQAARLATAERASAYEGAPRTSEATEALWYDNTG